MTDYYHCFMGNGLDALLVGYTGAMVPERAQGNLDRCCWYKADRYYPEERAVVIPERLPREGQPLRAEGAPWRELAPLAHTWYEVRHGGLRLDCRLSEQLFSPREGILHSHVDYGAVTAEVDTFLHANRSLLVIHCRFDKPVSFRACAAAGVWAEEAYDVDPFDSVTYSADGTAADYTLGTTSGRIILALIAPPGVHSTDNRQPTIVRGPAQAADSTPLINRQPAYCHLEVQAQEATQLVAVVDDLDGPLDTHAIEEACSLGYEALREEHVAVWRDYSTHSKVEIPDVLFQRSYDFSLYQFKAAQNRLSGGLPVNNLRLTWSSHVFWDAYFVHRALLEANRRAEALEGVTFFMRTLEHARRHASEEFGAPGLKWDWEITHRGERAYGTWLHQKEQVHNNASYANMIWGYYEFTRDRDYLAAFYPILRGMAEFFLANVVTTTGRGYEVRPLVDVAERVTPVKNEGLNLTGAIRILQLVARASKVLQRDEEFAAGCSETARGLVNTLDMLYNGHYFRCAEGVDALSPSSLAPIYPMRIIRPDDPRAISTARCYFEREHKDVLSPWYAGVLATIFALQGDGDAAWQVITQISGAICKFGGMSEHVYPGGRWNMQYFGTAQSAICTAIHHLLLQSREGEISLFPAVPSDWPTCSYDRLLANGVEVSARLNRNTGQASAEMLNIAADTLVTKVSYGGHTEELVLPPGQRKRIEWNDQTQNVEREDHVRKECNT